MFSCKNFKITPKEKERKVLISDQHWQSTICNSGARCVEAAVIHICSRTHRATKHTHETACCYHNDNFTLDHDIRTRSNTLTFACLFAPNIKRKRHSSIESMVPPPCPTASKLGRSIRTYYYEHTSVCRNQSVVPPNYAKTRAGMPHTTSREI